MSRRIKLFTSISTFTMIGALALGGCSDKANHEGDEGSVSTTISAEGAEGQHSESEGSESEGSESEGSESEGGESEGGESEGGESEGGESEGSESEGSESEGSESEGSESEGSESEGGESEGGESEGGESEGASGGANPVTSDVEYLHRLGQVRGHLTVFIALHQLGAHEMSRTHAKHPKSELYADLIPAFQRRSMAGFANELEALSRAVADGGDLETAYRNVSASITKNEPNVSVATHLAAISKVTRTAGDEFNIGVTKDGTIVNAHEYQDAYGFLMAARKTLDRLKPDNNEEREAVDLAKQQLTTALKEFGDLTAAKTNGKSSVLYGAAARIELAGLGL